MIRRYESRALPALFAAVLALHCGGDDGVPVFPSADSSAGDTILADGGDAGTDPGVAGDVIPDGADVLGDAPTDVPVVDETAPTVFFTQPLDGQTVADVVDVVVTARDDEGGLGAVTLFVAGEPLGEPLAEEPFTWSWDTSALVSGPYTLSVTATDQAGNEASAEATVRVAGACNEEGDCPPSSVRIINPVDGAAGLCGEFVIEATATDDVGIDRIEFYLGEVPLGVAEESPYQYAWNTLNAGDGPHVLRALAFDTSEQASFDEIEVEVRNDGDTCDNFPSVVLTSPEDGVCFDGVVELSADASDDTGVIEVGFFINNGLLETDTSVPYAIEWDAGEFDEGAYTVKATATDTGDQDASSQVTVIVDRTSPEAAFVHPGGEDDPEWYETTLPVELDVTDNFAVSDVDIWFLSFDDSDTPRVSLSAPPWEATLDVTDIDGGEWDLQVRATDCAGATTTETVEVVIDRAPTLLFLAPTDGSTVEGPLDLLLTANDDRTELLVDFYVDDEFVATLEERETYRWEPEYEKAERTLRVDTVDEVGHTASSEVVVQVDHPLEVELQVCVDDVCLTPPEERESSDTVLLFAEVRDDGGAIERVEWSVDGSLVATDDEAPYEFEWDTTAETDGLHTLRAAAFNTDGSDGEAVQTFQVNNCDRDDDGFLSTTCDGTDCDDEDELRNPGEDDTVGDAVDNDCDGIDGVDFDGDLFASVESGGTDCDDEDDGIFVGAEDTVGDGVDNNCDDVDGVDFDGDRFASELSGGDDCADGAPEVNPGALEVCDGVDNNCADGVDEGTPAELGCVVNAICSGLAGCSCSAGFERDEGDACVDVDECASSTHDCDANAVCSNTSPGFGCECNEFYEGDGRTCVYTGFCGDGFVQEGEECDDGVENSDLVPDACRSACALPVCGDLVVDSGEECDLGEENDDESACRSACSVNLGIACVDVPEFVDLSVDGEETETGITYSGRTRGAGADHAPADGCVEDPAASGADIMFVYTAAADGPFMASTANLGTVDDTILYRVNDCTDQVPGVCNDDTNGTGSRIIIEHGIAGMQYFIVVDSHGEGGLFQLDIEPIAGVSGDGEACSDTILCSGGLLCIEALCIANAAPVLDSIVAVTDDLGNTRHTFAGTDPNLDTETWYIDAVTLEDGTVNDGGIFPTAEPFVTWDGAAFELEFTINWPSFQGQLITSLTGHVIDAEGNESERVTIEVLPYTAPATGLGAGDDCDLERLVNLCAPPLTCTSTEDGDVCDDAEAPVLDALSAVRTGSAAVRFFMDGSDINGDLSQWGTYFLDAEGGVIFGPAEFVFDGSTMGDPSFGATATINGLTVESGIVSAEIWLIDSTGLESGRMTVEVPVPSTSGTSGPCDPEGIDATCEAGLTCSPGDGGWTCQPGSAPEVTRLEAAYIDLLTLEAIVYYVEGIDLNGDVVEMDITVFDPEGGTADLTIDNTAMTPDPTGRVVFGFTSVDIDTGGTLFVDTAVVLRDSTGLESAAVFDPLGDEVGEGDPCSPDGVDGACTDGLVCGIELTCEEALPPVLVSLSALRVSSGEVQFIIEGTDPNGDVVGQTSSLLDAAGGVVVGPLELIIDDDVTGLDTFTVTSTIGGFDAFAEATDVDLFIRDGAGLTSDSLLVAIPPLRGVGEDCVGDGVTDLCTDGASCVEGVCGGTSPFIASATARQNEDNSRLLDVTITGTDPDADIVSMTIDFFDSEGVSILGAPIDLAADALADPFGVSYVAREFTFRSQFTWEDEIILGVADGEVTVTDSLDQTDGPFAFSFRPTVGLGETCDELEEDFFCATGLACLELVCGVDAEDHCGGIPIIDVAAAGEFVEGEGTYVAFDSSGRENLAEADCGPFGPSVGAEVAAFWVAPSAGTLTVTTMTEATGTYDTYIYARSGFCSDPAAEVGCNDDFGGTLQSSITFDVDLGEEVYVILDGYGAGGAGEALFIFETRSGLGESCETLPCAAELFCDGTTTCVAFTPVDGDCSAVPCVDGLTCDADSICRASVAEGGDCSGVIPCDDGLTCDEGDLCAPPIAEGGGCGGLVPCAAGLLCDVVCRTAASSCEVATLIATDATTFGGELTDTFDDVIAPCGSNGPEIVFEWTSDTDGTVVIDTAASTVFDTILYVNDGVCGDIGGAVCNDDSPGGGFLSEVEIAAVSGTTYYLYVESYGGSETGAISGAITRP